MQDALASAAKAADAMAPPTTWTLEPDPMRARLFDVTDTGTTQGTAEYKVRSLSKQEQIKTNPTA